MPNTIKDAESRLEINNLINIYSASSGIDKQLVIDDFALKDIIDFKKSLTEVIIEVVEPIALEANKLINDKKYLEVILKQGAEKAREISSKKISELYSIIGMI